MCSVRRLGIPAALAVLMALSSGVAVARPGPPPWVGPRVPPGGDDPPPTLITVSGTLQRSGTTYTLNGVETDFGARWYITSTTAPNDYDGDGTRERIVAELDGLLGRRVTLQVEVGRRGDDDVFTINGLFYRATDGSPPPWAGGPFRR